MTQIIFEADGTVCRYEAEHALQQLVDSIKRGEWVSAVECSLAGHSYNPLLINFSLVKIVLLHKIEEVTDE